MVFDVMLSTVNYLGNLYYFFLKFFCQIRERKDTGHLVCKENSLIEDYAYTLSTVFVCREYLCFIILLGPG